jgi:cyclic pyranopterin phosphate synthase
MPSFTHIDSTGRVKMVDVTDKPPSLRTAVAQARLVMKTDTLEKIKRQTIRKGNVLEAARIAGIMAAKKTAELIPLCHPLNITHVQIEFAPDPVNNALDIAAEVRLVGQTGVEMEALTAASITALTVYDMCKSYDREMLITGIALVKKSGGKSGTYIRSRTAGPPSKA